MKKRLSNVLISDKSLNTFYKNTNINKITKVVKVKNQWKLKLLM